jgi:hypothetical protein
MGEGGEAQKDAASDHHRGASVGWVLHNCSLGVKFRKARRQRVTLPENLEKTGTQATNYSGKKGGENCSGYRCFGAQQNKVKSKF